MKIKFTSGLIVNVVIGLAICSLFSNWAIMLFRLTGSAATTGTSSSVTIINNLKPVTETIPDSIPYYLHKRVQDSITQLRTLRNGDGPTEGSEVYFALWGTHVSNYCDTCKIQYNKWASPSQFPIYDKPTRSYLILTGWKIAPAPFIHDTTTFHVEHGQAYLRKQAVDSTHRDSKGMIEKIARTRDIPISFSYNRRFNCIMIPIGPGTKIILDRVFTTVAIIGILYFMFFIVGGFIKFLIDVSRGQTFTLKNIRRLKIIGISLVVIEALTVFLNLCMPLIFHTYFTNDVVLSEKSWDGSWKWFVAGIAFLLLYKAFRNGKKIKDEQDLVI